MVDALIRVTAQWGVDETVAEIRIEYGKRIDWDERTACAQT